jgi:prephenate dehydratase/chorismate mutase
MTEDRVKDPRSEIDEIDAELLKLLNRRADIALRVGAAKSSVDGSLCDTNREREVLSRLTRENNGPFSEQSIENIFQRIIDESLNLQQQQFHRPAVGRAGGTVKMAGRSRVAFLGERGTFSEEAALGILGDDCETVSFPNFDSLFQAITEDKADYILTPLENSLVGSVHRCYDLLLNSDLNIAAEVILPVSHYLVGCETASIETIRSVESHPAALAQCERFFAAHPNLQRIAADDTAGSVRRAVEGNDPTRAAIGGRRAAAIYGGKILRDHIEDHSENFTRFALLSREPTQSSDAAKVSLVLRLKHEPGALHNALRPFVRRGIDLLKIESRPVNETPSQFYFYLDVRAPAIENDLTGALKDVSEQADELRHLGRYPTIEIRSDNNV